jgi:hypothetical protein
MDQLGTSDLSSPATNGASCDSGSALSLHSNGVTEALANLFISAIRKRLAIEWYVFVSLSAIASDSWDRRKS